MEILGVSPVTPSTLGTKYRSAQIRVCSKTHNKWITTNTTLMPNHSDFKIGLYHLFNETCTKSFNLTPHDWQGAIGATILEVAIEKSLLRHLCVCPTGGGKSLVFNVVASLLKLVTILHLSSTLVSWRRPNKQEDTCYRWCTAASPPYWLPLGWNEA